MAGQNRVMLKDFQQQDFRHMKGLEGWVNVIYDIPKINFVFFIIFILFFYQRVGFAFIHVKEKRKHEQSQLLF